MSNFLKTLASPFIEFDETPAKKKEVPSKSTPSHPAIITMSDNLSAPSFTMASPEFEGFKSQFASILADENKRNYPGNDYFEFVVMKNAMNAIPQESMRYTVAFAGWVTGGNQSKQSLLSTAQVYLGLVDKEIADFETAYKAQYNAKVGKNEDLINAKIQKVQELTSQINILNGEINSLREGIQSAAATLVQKHDAFMAAGQMQRQEILDEITKINQHIN